MVKSRWVRIVELLSLNLDPNVYDLFGDDQKRTAQRSGRLILETFGYMHHAAAAVASLDVRSSKARRF